MSFEYKKAKTDIFNTLNSKVPVLNQDSIPGKKSLLSSENGVKTWVGSIFVDIVDSTSLFTNSKHSDNVIARVMRSFVEQIVSIMKDNRQLYEVGIRGDCVFGIFQAKKKEMLVEMFDTACTINTFMRMFNKILKEQRFPEVKAGIGLGSSQELVIMVGKKQVVHDKIWIGDAVVNASNLSSIANRGSIESICMDKTTYGRIISSLIKEDSDYRKWIKETELECYPSPFYQCNMVQSNFNEWIEGGMK